MVMTMLDRASAALAEFVPRTPMKENYTLDRLASKSWSRSLSMSSGLNTSTTVSSKLVWEDCSTPQM
jgi:hypothetical protein